MQAALRTLLVTAFAAAGALLPVVSPHAQAADGLNSLFIGHSFFRPFAEAMPFHATQAGIAGHTQSVVFAGGANGAPQALWEDAAKRAEIQGILDGGDVELFGMTVHGDYPGTIGYENWIDYALAQNPNTIIMLALPWLPYPATMTAAVYETNWHASHATAWHDLIDYLRSLYPGVNIFGNPYGQSAVELRLLFEAGNLPDVSLLTGTANDAIYTDALGHAGNILVALGELVWLNAIYDVDLTSYAYDPGYTTALKPIAQAIMDAHDATYGETPMPGCGDVPLTGCRSAAKASLVYRDNVSDSKDRLTYKWSRGEATSQAEFGDPLITTQYDLCIYASAGTPLVYEGNVPADAAKWKPISTRGFKYTDKYAAAGGAQRILLKGSDSPKSKVLWKGKGLNLPDPPPATLPIPAIAFPLLVQISGSTTPACFETNFESADTITNETDSLKLKQ